MLTVRMDELDGVQSRIHVEASAERVEEEINAVARRYRKELQVPGFRKGKAPLRLIKSRFREALQGELLSEWVPKLYQEALDQEGFVPLAQAEIEDMEYETGESLRFAALVELKPDIEVAGYDGLEATRTLYKVRDEQVDQWVAHQRERHAQIEMVHRPAREGDVILVDLQRIDRGGIPIVGERMENQQIELGASHNLGEAFDQQIAGAGEGEERRVELAAPEQEPVFFSVKVKEIHEKTLSELDDDFAKDVGFDTLRELREKVGTHIKARMDEASEEEMHSELVNQLIAQNAFDAPQTMVDNYLKSIIEEVKRRSPGELNEKALREQERGSAIRHIKTHLILQGIASAEHIEVPDEEIEDPIRKAAEGSKTSFEALRDAMKSDGRWERMHSDLLEKKAMDFIVDRADIKEVVKDQKQSGLVVPASVADDLGAEKEAEEIALTE
jgi:trigger factor